MAILFVEGFEHQTANSLLTGWNSGPQNIESGLVNAPAGAPAGIRSGRFSDAFNYRYFQWRQNVSAARAVRVRLAHCNFNAAVSSTSRSNPFIFTEANIQASAGFRLSGSTIIACRSTTTLGSVAFAYATNTFYPFKMSVYVDVGSGGSVDIYQGEAPSPALSLTGVDTKNGANNYIDGMAVQGQNFQSILYLDDIVVYAPSILLDVGSGSVAAGDTLIIGGASTVVVSDVDTSPDAPNVAVTNSLVRVWIDTWDENTFSDGSAVVGGTLSNTSVVAPNAAYQGGFEPYSWPQFEAVVGRYVTRQTWSGNNALGLTPVGSASNVENIDNVPLDSTTYNEATSGATEFDTYDTPIALPSGVQAIRGVQVRASGQSFGTYNEVEAVLTDGSGSQSLSQPLSSIAENQVLQICELDSAGVAWGTTLPTQGSYLLKP